MVWRNELLTWPPSGGNYGVFVVWPCQTSSVSGEDDQLVSVDPIPGNNEERQSKLMSLGMMMMILYRAMDNWITDESRSTTTTRASGMIIMSQSGEFRSVEQKLISSPDQLGLIHIDRRRIMIPSWNNVRDLMKCGENHRYSLICTVHLHVLESSFYGSRFITEQWSKFSREFKKDCMWGTKDLPSFTVTDVIHSVCRSIITGVNTMDPFIHCLLIWRPDYSIYV